MKFITTLSVLLFFFFSVNAQYNKGARLLGGTVSFGSSKQKNENWNYDSKTTSFSFNPQVGTFYKANRLAGVHVGYYSLKRDSLNTGRSYGGGVFLRQYFPLGKSSFSFFSQEKVSAQFGNSYSLPQPGKSVKITETYASAGLQVGMAYGITRRLQVELQFPELLGIGYNKRTPKGANRDLETASTNFAISTGLTNHSVTSIGLGLAVLL